MAFLEWRTPNGCATCRPALNYYLISTWPKEAKDDPQSRFINERAHANIQKDGTFSVVPRMWGGETTASELRADRRRRRQVRDPDGEGHRRPAHRPARREESRTCRRCGATSGMPSGHAYAKALRTVKTCVGSRVVPLRHAGLDADGQGPRARAVADVRAAQGQARGVGLPAQLRRVGDQGRRRDRRRFRLGDLCRGQRRHQDRSRAVPGQGEDGRRSARIRRRVPAALSRGRLVSRAHRALRLARRPRLRQEAGARRCRRAGEALWERLQFALDGEPDPVARARTARASMPGSSFRLFPRRRTTRPRRMAAPVA